MKIEKLSGEYIRGYTKAIRDITEILNYVSQDLKNHHKTMNINMINRLMNFCLINREKIREDMNGFIRWNSQLADFEWFKSKE